MALQGYTLLVNFVISAIAVLRKKPADLISAIEMCKKLL